MDLSAEALTLRVSDNGIGLPDEADQQGFGLRGMRERITQLGGSVELSSAKGGRHYGANSASEHHRRKAMTEPDPTSVLIADDQRLMLDGLRTLLELEPDVNVVEAC